MAQANTATAWPGPEIGDDYLRALARKLVREQGWRYIFRGSHPILRPPNKEHGQIPFASTASDWRARLNTVAQLKQAGARLDDLPETVAPPREAAAMLADETIESPWTMREWRERQRNHEEWWRRQYADPEPPTPAQRAADPEPELPPAWARYREELMARLARGTEVKDDARGDKGFTLANARQMLKDGYSLAHVIKTTGWGRMWLADLAERLDNG